MVLPTLEILEFQKVLALVAGHTFCSLGKDLALADAPLRAGCPSHRLARPVEDLGPVAKSISASIDSRGHVLDMASPELAQVRQKIAAGEERVQNKIKHILRD